MGKEISNIDNEWIPPHGLSRGYPWNGVQSKIFSEVMSLFEFNKKAEVEDYYFSMDGKKIHVEEKGVLEAGYILQEALKVAEEQVMDMLSEKPFVPENFKFEAVVKPKGTSDVPVTIYQSQLNENVVIFRQHRSDYGWTIQQRQPEGTTPPIKETNVLLPCERIAVAVFYALGIKVVEN